MDDFNDQEQSRSKVRAEYFEFLSDLREYMAEFVRESVVELTITEVAVPRQIQLFNGHTPGKAKIKNQGKVPCYLGTREFGGYKLEPGETVEFFVNRAVWATTTSGSTVLGFIHT